MAAGREGHRRLTEGRLRAAEFLATVPVYGAFLVVWFDSDGPTGPAPLDLLVVFGVAALLPGAVIAGTVGVATLLRRSTDGLSADRVDAVAVGAFLVGAVSLPVAIVISLGSPERSPFVTVAAGLVAAATLVLFVRANRRAVDAVRGRP